MLNSKHKLEFKSGKKRTKRIVEAGSQPDEPVPNRYHVSPR